MQKIGPNHGVEATRKRLIEEHPEHEFAFNRVFGEPGQVYPANGSVGVEGTILKLVEGHNELTDGDVLARLAALEAQPPVPFPASS